MAGAWIYQTDKDSYVSVMNQMCSGPSIIKETEDKLQVNFCSAAMQVWVQAGFWYSFNE